MPFIQDQNEIREDYKIKKKTTFVRFVLTSRQTQGIFLLLVFSILAPVLFYYFMANKGGDPPKPKDTCAVNSTYRIPCGNPEKASFDYCSDIFCCFDNATQSCFHFLPSKYNYSDDDGKSEFQKSLNETPFGKNQLDTIALTVNQVDQNVVQIILHETTANLKPTNDVKDANYHHSVSKNPLYIEVKRRNTNELLLTTAKGPIIASENYWEWSFQLTEEYLFGLGQTLINLDQNSTLTRVIYSHGGDHNTLASFLAYQNGSWHGLVVRHSGPLEVTVLPSKLVLLKSLTGHQLALELSVGPTVQQVTEQLTGKTGTNAVTMATLGVHLCREGTSTILKELLNDYKNEKSQVVLDFDYESDCLHENLITALRNEEDPYNINAMVEILTNFNEKSFTLALPPQVTFQSKLYNDTKDLDIFYKNKTSDYLGLFLDQKVAYPNFQHPSIGPFVQKIVDEIQTYFGSVTPKNFLLVRNWPSDDSFEMEETETFQYLSKELIDAMSLTLPWNTSSDTLSHFENHNDYGTFQLEEIRRYFSEDLFITASHNFDTVQPIMLQDVELSWTSFQKAITTTLFNGIFGFPLTSVPVCGSTSTFNSSYESLCLRWYLMAVTAPIFRLSSDSPRRDPNSIALTMSNFTAGKTKWAIDFRNSLKYYFYTILTNGEPLMRPMFYDFPKEVETFDLLSQYMVGKDLLVAHPTLPDQTLLKIYLPESAGTWYEFWGGGTYNSTNGWINLPIVETDWVGFIREGAVISLVEKDPNDGTKMNLILKIALKCDTLCSASGFLKTELGSFSFVSTDEHLTIQNEQSQNFFLSQVEILKKGSDSVRYNATNDLDLSQIDSCSYSIELGLEC